MIRIRQLHKRFGHRPVLDGLDLDLLPRDRTALIGSNGAGKTTLLRCLLGEYHCTGEISVEGLDPREQRQEILMHTGFVPQLPPPLKLHVGELIQLTARLSGVEPTEILQVAELLGLTVEEIRHRPFVKLSGGMKQKLLIAIALGRRPRLLIMDEPAANLDPEARKAFFLLLAQTPPETMMLLSSHRIDEIAGLVNRVVEMDQGRVVLDERLADTGEVAQRLMCILRLTRSDPAMVAELERWGLLPDVDGMHWRGEVAAPDRPRFLGAITRFSNHLADFSWSSGK